MPKYYCETHGLYTAYNEKCPECREFKKDYDSAEKILKLEEKLALYGKAVNRIDDYFEYNMSSKTDQAVVHGILDDLVVELCNPRGIK